MDKSSVYPHVEMSTVMPTSIHEMLLGRPPPPSEQGATGLIRRLLELLANEAVDSSTNTLLSYSLVKLAREKGDSIDEVFGTIETKAEADAWALFDQGVKDVYELEDKLLEIKSLLPQSLSLEPDNTMDGKAGIEAWESKRTELLDHLGKFQSRAADETPWEQRCDDASLFRSLMRKIKLSESQLNSPALKVAVDALNNVLTNIDEYPSAKITFGIKAAWLVKAAISEYKSTTNPNRRRYLAQDDVWTAAKSVALLISSTATALQVQAKYQEFVSKLDISAVTLAAQTYFDLIKASIKVSRPFMARSKVLVDYSRLLVIQYNGNKTTEGEEAVNQAIAKCSRALAAAKNVPLDGEVTSRASIVKAFEDAEGQLGAALKLYPSIDAPGLSVKMQQAEKEDEDRLAGLKGRASKVSAKVDNSLPVNVTLRTRNAQKSVLVNGSTRVGALLWEEKVLDAKNKTMFVRRVGQLDMIDLDTKVADLTTTGTLALDISGTLPVPGSPETDSEIIDLPQQPHYMAGSASSSTSTFHKLSASITGKRK